MVAANHERALRIRFRLGRCRDSLPSQNAPASIRESWRVGYSSLFSFRFPQRISLRSVNLRSTLRFRARSTPMRACITKSRPSAAPIRQPVAVCHSSRSCSGFGNIMMKSAASRRVSSSHPSSGIGSSKGRDQAAAGFNWAISYPPSGMCRNAQLPFFSAASTAALSGQIVPLS